MNQISATALHALLSAEGGEKPALIDVREPWEWQLAHIEGAKHLPMNEIPARVDELDKTHPTVVICHHGMRSLDVTVWLRGQGVESAKSLAGGIERWSTEIDPQVPRY